MLDPTFIHECDKMSQNILVLGLSLGSIYLFCPILSLGS